MAGSNWVIDDAIYRLVDCPAGYSVAPAADEPFNAAIQRCEPCGKGGSCAPLLCSGFPLWSLCRRKLHLSACGPLLARSLTLWWHWPSLSAQLSVCLAVCCSDSPSLTLCRDGVRVSALYRVHGVRPGVLQSSSWHRCLYCLPDQYVPRGSGGKRAEQLRGMS